MEKHENTLIRETTDNVIFHELTDEKNGPTFVREYLKAEFLSSAVDGLFYARRQANLTQAQVAELLNTKQAAIARLEGDTDGSISLRRYIEFALACGAVPLDITFAPIDSVRNFILAHPELPVTQKNYDTWLLQKEILSMLTSQSVQMSTVANQSMVAAVSTIQMSTSSILNIDEYRKQTSLSVVGEEQFPTSQKIGGGVAA